MIIMELMTSKCTLLPLNSNILRFSCWIESEDGAIAAFIVPIVIIILVRIYVVYIIHYKLCR